MFKFILRHVRNMNEGISSVLTKFARKKAMSAAALTSITRNALGALVEREERRTGSRMVAYEVVAQTIGASSSWVRAFLGKSEGVKEPRITLFQNIRASYENLCSRVEQENRDDERRLALIREKIDAVTQGFGEQVGRQD
ncbi:hypothetical protein CO683_00715 [Bradyrhizobium ottawaense]|uniref:hypothetical protein n=1 Tax=Bradyrhizobium ottawaense TaxID=931866 RepID=UPI000BEAC29C|nr:hypothetical protein [Bradyrhizobium ottawaense]PDT71714.1 hypothetical protein CO683_00715 [Bradyrhizobium ottawaense]